MQRKTFKKALSLVLSLVLLVGTVFTGVTASAEGTYTAYRITIHPGIDDTYLNFNWQSDSVAQAETGIAAVRIKVKDDTDADWTVFTGECDAFVISADGYEEGYHDTAVKNCGHTCSDVCGHEACTASQCYHGTYTYPYYNQVTVSGLEYGVSYTYQLGDGTNWTSDYTTQIADADPNEGFSYLVFGDSQTAEQYYGDYMKNALELAVKDEKFSDIDFLMNLGDNIHENNNRNYNAYYTAQDILAQYPTAVVLGNHELNLCTNGDRVNFSDHPTLALQNPPAADERQDYWFRYGDVLFITFNSGPQQSSMFSSLEQLIIDAKAAHPDTRWTILQTHQSFYGNNGSGKVWRKDFMNVLSKYDIDLVFVGHAHQYTRSESIVYDSSATCTAGCTASNPSFSCTACSGSVETLGENDVTVKENFYGATNVSGASYDLLDPVEYDKTVERYDPEGITVIQLDSLTAEGHDTYASTASSTLKATTAYANNGISGQGAITKVTVTENELKVETYWINNNGTPRTYDEDPDPLTDDYIEDTPYDTYTIHKTTAVKDTEVTFDGGSDRGIFTRKINAGDPVAEPENPVLTGKSFLYWTADGETAFDFTNPISADTTLTAVYTDIPPTTTAKLFVDAVKRGDSEIILEADITLTGLGDIEISTGTTITSAEGQKYTLTLDGNTRLATAAGSKVTFDNINITLASTITTMSDGWTAGGYIKTGSGGSKLYIYNCTICCEATTMGGAYCAIISPAGNTTSYVYINNSTITSNTENECGALIGGRDAVYYVTDSTLKPKASNYWLSHSNPTLVVKGNASYSGYYASAKIYDFTNASVKIARNADDLIELTKIGSGTAVTDENYKIYYSLGDDASGTTTEYTEPIADVDYTTVVYATIKYTGKSYTGTITSKTCGEYIEGVEVSDANAFVAAIENGDSVTLASDITLSGLGEIVIGADIKITSKKGQQYTITLDGDTRLTVGASKTVIFENINVVVASTADTLDSDTAYYSGYITVNSSANLYVKNCTIKTEQTNMGSSTTALIKIYRVSANPGYVQLEDSTMVSPSGQNMGVALNGINHESAKPVFRIIDSSITGNWIFYQCRYILEGTTTYSGYNSGTIYDFRNTTVKAARNKEGLIELSKTGTGAAATDDTFKIYYSIGENTTGTTTEYTAAIENVNYETPVYVTLRYGDTDYYTTPVANICGEYIEGTPVATEEQFTAAIKNCDPIITLTADITLNYVAQEVIPSEVKIQSKEGSRFTITLDGATRLAISPGGTVTFENININIASTIKTVTELGFENGWYAGGYINTTASSKLYINNCAITCEATTLGAQDAAIIRPYGNHACDIYINNSSLSAQLGIGKGALVGGNNAVFYVTDSVLKAKTSDSYLAVNSPTIVFYGSSTNSGWYNTTDTTIYDFRNASVTAERDSDGNVVLTKTGTGTAVTSDSYLIYYSTDGATYTEYTAALEGISADTTLYVAIYYTGTSYRSTPVALTVPDGDINADGAVDATDLALIRQDIVNGTATEGADLNGDGEVDILDLVALSLLITETV